MRDIIMSLNLPQETKDFLCKIKIEALFEKARKEFSLIDSKVVIDYDEDNIQFWNGVLESFREWCLE